MLMLYSIGAETDAPITCGKITAEPQPLPENACLGRDLFSYVRGKWFRLNLDEGLYGFADELEQDLPWRCYERYNSPLYFKNEEILADFKSAVQSVLSLSPGGEGIFLPLYHNHGLANNNICGVISDAELFRLLEDCKILLGVHYIVKKTEDLTERFLKARERGLFTKEERSAAIEKISAQIPGCEVDEDDNTWWHFTGGGKHVMMHGYLKILFTNADITLEGDIEILRYSGYNEPEFSIDLNTVRDILDWYSEEYVVNPLFFSVGDLFFATV